MSQRRFGTLLTAFRGLSRAGVVLCLLLAALSLSVGESEYPGYTRPALLFLATEVLPLMLVGFVNIAALDAPHSRSGWLGLLSVEVNLALLVYALRAVTVGAPPYAFMLASVAGVLVVATLATAVSLVYAPRAHVERGVPQP
jgi:hypothetical protein